MCRLSARNFLCQHNKSGTCPEDRLALACKLANCFNEAVLAHQLADGCALASGNDQSIHLVKLLYPLDWRPFGSRLADAHNMFRYSALKRQHSIFISNPSLYYQPRSDIRSAAVRVAISMPFIAAPRFLDTSAISL